MGLPVVTVSKGGLAVTDAIAGLPVDEATTGRGIPVTYVASGGLPVRSTTTRFYVDGVAGNDGNSGSQSLPWKTIPKVNGSSFVAPSAVYFMGGQTYAGPLTAVAGVTYASYGPSLATISAVSNANGILATNQSNIIIKDLNVTGAGGTSGAGVKILNTSGNASNITIRGITASGFAAQGIEVTASGGQISNINISDCTVLNCTTGNADSTGTAGIKVMGVYGAQVSTNYGIRNISISNCIVHDCPGVAGTPNWCGSGIFVSECDTGVITNCIAYNTGTLCNGPTGPAGIWIADARTS